MALLYLPLLLCSLAMYILKPFVYELTSEIARFFMAEFYIIMQVQCVAYNIYQPLCDSTPFCIQFPPRVLHDNFSIFFFLGSLLLLPTLSNSQLVSHFFHSFSSYCAVVEFKESFYYTLTILIIIIIIVLDTMGDHHTFE